MHSLTGVQMHMLRMPDGFLSFLVQAFVDFENYEEAAKAMREKDHKVFHEKFGDRYVRLIQVSSKLQTWGSCLSEALVGLAVKARLNEMYTLVWTKLVKLLVKQW
jgi:hypothetical protein